MTMKQKMLLFLMSIVFGIWNVAAQTANTFEGEITSKVNSVQKAKSQVTTSNFLAKMIVKSIMKKNFDNNPGFYTGVYDVTTISKGNKTRVNSSYNNSVVVTEKEGDKMKITTYYPYIKKGYYTVTNMTESQKQVEEMRKGKVEKTGETMTILGRKCDVYKVKFEMNTDSAGTKSLSNLHNEFAICTDTSLPEADKEIIPGVKGTALKFTNNTASQISNEMLNIDFLMSISTIVTSISPRTVADSELEIPSDIKLFDCDKDPKKMLKTIEENKKYMEKKKLWVEKSPDDMKIYDNLSEDWDF